MESYIIYEKTFENKIIIGYNSFFTNITVDNIMPIFSLHDISKDYIEHLLLTKRVILLLHSHFPEKEIYR